MWNRQSLKSAVALMLLPLVSACSLAPGMKYSDSPPAPGVRPVLKEITPQLLKDERDAKSRAIDSDAAALFADPKPYTVGIGDVLAINMMGQRDMPSVSVILAPIPNSQADSMVTSGFAVDQDGEVYLPYVGAVKVAGLTMRDLHAELARQFAKYIRKPDFTVHISSYRSKRVFISGEVRTPGVVPIIDIPMTLPEALSMAGGWTSLGDPGSVEIDRNGKQYVVNIPQLTEHGMNPSRILLQNGDLVRVPSLEESKVYVIGDVVRPSALLRPNSHLTLNDALSGAGGVNPESGNAGQVYVVRHASDSRPEIYHLDASSPVALALADSFELRAKDVVYVDAAPLARWNRVISLILPTAQLVVDSKYLNLYK
jgi:polysaccharide export outer membrane protein